jgi:hypothetical protein
VSARPAAPIPGSACGDYPDARSTFAHASISTTLNIHAHAVDASHCKAIEAVERELFVVFATVDAGLEPAPPASSAVHCLWK